eukprot:TRINITY_DN34337_c0_g1_i1.p1 TRINITY_DN34337_c0_g1~~TRINITY_DN34337_c0_g1_i1.p1  ORF type:complete len:225 (-),score=55.41 TRINITY_DN34337_c0_g1_i1:27-701(-)
MEAIARLVDDIQLSKDNDKIKAYLEESVALMKAKEETLDYFVRSGGCEACIKLLEDPSSISPEIGYVALLAMHLLTFGEEFRHRMIQSNAVPIILKAMRAWLKHEETLLEAAQVLANLGHLGGTWVPDEGQNACKNCARKFRMFMRPKHHCRHCGYVVCGECSDNSALVPIMGFTDTPVRLCLNCYPIVLKVNKVYAKSQKVQEPEQSAPQGSEITEAAAPEAM